MNIGRITAIFLSLNIVVGAGGRAQDFEAQLNTLVKAEKNIASRLHVDALSREALRGSPEEASPVEAAALLEQLQSFSKTYEYSVAQEPSIQSLSTDEKDLVEKEFLKATYGNLPEWLVQLGASDFSVSDSATEEQVKFLSAAERGQHKLGEQKQSLSEGIDWQIGGWRDIYRHNENAMKNHLLVADEKDVRLFEPVHRGFNAVRGKLTNRSPASITMVYDTYLKLESVPPGAIISVNGNPLDTPTPYVFLVISERAIVRLALPGYEPVEFWYEKPRKSKDARVVQLKKLEEK